MKVCIEEGCWQPTPNTRCAEHEREFRRPKDRKYGRGHRAQPLDAVCACCGSTEDLCRDHVRTQVVPGLGHYRTDYQTLCRSCNGSKGGRVMTGTTCPMHGGVEA